MTFTSFNPQIIHLGFRYTTLVVILIIGDIPFSALDDGVNLVKSTNKRPIKVGPMSVLTVSGIYKSKIVLETAVSECVDDTKGNFRLSSFFLNVTCIGFFTF
jgi:hypothetical protein